MRWLLLPVSLVIVGLAAWLVLATPGAQSRRAPVPAVGAGPSGTSAPAKPGQPRAVRSDPTIDGMTEIDEASRRQLEEVLEREGIGP